MTGTIFVLLAFSLNEIEIIKSIKASNQALAPCFSVQMDKDALVSFYRQFRNPIRFLYQYKKLLIISKYSHKTNIFIYLIRLFFLFHYILSLPSLTTVLFKSEIRLK